MKFNAETPASMPLDDDRRTRTHRTGPRICHGIRTGGWIAVAVVLFLTTAAAIAQQQSVNPGINRHYDDPDYLRWVGVFERPGREIYDRRLAILAATGAGPGMEIADIGAGTGLFTLLFADKVGPAGRVFAVDISEVFIENIVRRARQRGLSNVQGVVNEPRDVMLAPASVDMAFVCDTYHHFEYPQEILDTIRRALRPGGSLVIIDFRKIPGISTRWFMNHVRADRASVIREIEAAGFRLAEELDLLKTNYFLRFEKS